MFIHRAYIQDKNGAVRSRKSRRSGCFDAHLECKIDDRLEIGADKCGVLVDKKGADEKKMKKEEKRRK